MKNHTPDRIEELMRKDNLVGLTLKEEEELRDLKENELYARIRTMQTRIDELEAENGKWQEVATIFEGQRDRRKAQVEQLEKTETELRALNENILRHDRQIVNQNEAFLTEVETLTAKVSELEAEVDRRIENTALTEIEQQKAVATLTAQVERLRGLVKEYRAECVERMDDVFNRGTDDEKRDIIPQWEDTIARIDRAALAKNEN